MLRRLKYFVSIVDCHSFTEAADRCFISQSALSQQMKLLEHELGTVLFYKKGRSFEVTDAGKVFYQGSIKLIDEYESLKFSTRNLNNQIQKDELRIGYLKYYSTDKLQAAISSFLELHPQVKLNLVGGSHEDLYDLLRTQKVDVVLNDQRRAFSDEYQNIVLKRTPCFAEFSKNSPLGKYTKISLQELGEFDCILIAPTDKQADEEYYYRNTFGVKSNFIFINSLDEARLKVASNLGYLIDIDDQEKESPFIKRVPLYVDKKRLYVNYCAFYQVDTKNPYVVEFVNKLSHLF